MLIREEEEEEEERKEKQTEKENTGTYVYDAIRCDSINDVAYKLPDLDKHFCLAPLKKHYVQELNIQFIYSFDRR